MKPEIVQRLLLGRLFLADIRSAASLDPIIVGKHIVASHDASESVLAAITDARGCLPKTAKDRGNRRRKSEAAQIVPPGRPGLAHLERLRWMGWHIWNASAGWAGTFGTPPLETDR